MTSQYDAFKERFSFSAKYFSTLADYIEGASKTPLSQLPLPIAFVILDALAANKDALSTALKERGKDFASEDVNDLSSSFFDIINKAAEETESLLAMYRELEKLLTPN